MENNRDLQLDGHPTGAVLMAALDQELSPQENSAVAEHVAACPGCAAQWERLGQLSGRLTEFHRTISSLPEFELQLPPDPRPASVLGSIQLFLRRPQFYVPAAALAAAVVGFILWTGSRTSVPISPAPLAAKIPEQGVPLAASKLAIPVAPQTQIAAIRRPRHLRSTAPPQPASLPQQPQNPAPNVSTAQTAEVFWYLPYSNPALAAEGAEMVQAELPREAFLMAGVPLANIPAPGPMGRIAADIVIGADGLPRAIRPARQQTSTMVIPTQL